MGLLWWFSVPLVCLCVGVETVVEAFVVSIGLCEEVEGFEAGFPYFPIELFDVLGCELHVCQGTPEFLYGCRNEGSYYRWVECGCVCVLPKVGDEGCICGCFFGGSCGVVSAFAARYFLYV